MARTKKGGQKSQIAKRTLVLLSLLCAAPWSSGSTMKAALNVEVTRDSADLQLRFAVVNGSDKSVTMFEHQLPWRGWQSLVLVAVKTDPGGTVLAQSLPVDDPGPSKIEIAPGQSVEGRVDLVKRFPELRAALRDRDVIVFWSYQFRSAKGEGSPRSGGYVVFERQGN